LLFSIAAGEVDDQGSGPHSYEKQGSISLLDTGMGGPASALGKSLWIQDPVSSSRYAEATLPASKSTAAETIPVDSGYMMLFHRLPSGDLQSQYMGYIYRGHQYRLLFSSDCTGTHEIWYRVGWKESNRILFHVL
jgi:hypothetical protein